MLECWARRLGGGDGSGLCGGVCTRSGRCRSGEPRDGGRVTVADCGWLTGLSVCGGLRASALSEVTRTRDRSRERTAEGACVMGAVRRV